jgi:hypothetical protein
MTSVPVRFREIDVQTTGSQLRSETAGTWRKHLTPRKILEMKQSESGLKTTLQRNAVSGHLIWRINDSATNHRPKLPKHFVSRSLHPDH